MTNIMQDSDVGFKNEIKRPDRLYNGEKPAFYFMEEFKIGDITSPITMEANSMKLTNLSLEMERYYLSLIEEKRKNGYPNLQALVFNGNNSVTMIVAIESKPDLPNIIKIHFLPTTEIDRIEEDHLRDLAREGKVINAGSGYVPFSSSGSTNESDMKAYTDSLASFKNQGKFKKSFKRAA